MSDRLLAADAFGLDLDGPMAAGREVLEGSPTARVRPLGELGEAEVGLWEMTAGTAGDLEGDEVFLVLSGEGTLYFSDGERIELRPGVVVRLRAGDKTRWQVRQSLRKLYFSR